MISRQQRSALEAPARLDAYTAMLTVSLGAMAIACILLFIDYSSYPTARPDEPPAPEVLNKTTNPASAAPTTVEKG